MEHLKILTAEPSVILCYIEGEEHDKLQGSLDYLTLASLNKDSNEAPLSQSQRQVMLSTTNSLQLAIMAKNEAVGEILAIPLRSDPSVIYLGYSVLEAHRRKGYATLAVRAVIDYYKANKGIDTFAASTKKDNLASQAVLKKVGFSFLGEGEKSNTLLFGYIDA